ncbi:MAG: hypothetical protein AVO38_14665 [delta proteobacterium ML8_D]|nr:MAG: hypothetical protein AVO38_14665 [delta proteobacterium ML8_D]
MKKLLTVAVSLVFLLCGAVTVCAWEYIYADEVQMNQHGAIINAYDLLKNEDTYLLDVRTPCEWYYVGHPGNDGTNGAFLGGKVFNISYWLWEINPKTKEYEYNKSPKFFDECVARLFKPGDTIIVMCKSDGRGGYAGDELEDPTTPACQRLEELDTYTVYNLGGGFEAVDKYHDVNGDDPSPNCPPSERVTSPNEFFTGWKPSGLPYVQSADGAFNPKLGANQGRSLK